MNKIEKIGATFVFCAAAAATAGCESEYDVDRKFHLIDDIVDNSLSKCDLSHEFLGVSQYKYALESILNNVWSEDLDFYLKYNVTVCLDDRLSDPLHGNFESIFYPDPNNPAVSLWYNGISGSGHGDDFLEDLAYHYSHDPYGINYETVKVGYEVSDVHGYTSPEWMNASYSPIINNHPEMKIAPFSWNSHY